MVLFFKCSSVNSKELNGFYYFIHESQISSCNFDLFPIINDLYPDIRNNINLVIVGNNFKLNGDFANFLNLKYIIDTNNIITSNYGITSLPSLIKIDSNKIDKTFNLPFINTKCKNLNFKTSKINLKEKISRIDNFIRHKIYYIFYDKNYNLILFYNTKDGSFKSINLLSIYDSISKNFNDLELIKSKDILKFESELINFYSNNDSIFINCRFADSLSINKTSNEGTFINSVLNNYNIVINNLANLNYEIIKKNISLTNKDLHLKDTTFLLNENEYNYNEFGLDKNNILDHKIYHFNYNNIKIVIYFRNKCFGKNIDLTKTSIFMNLYKNKILLSRENLMLPYKLSGTNDIYPVDFDGKRVKYFLYHATEGWIEIDQYLDFEF